MLITINCHKKHSMLTCSDGRNVYNKIMRNDKTQNGKVGLG